MKPADKKTAKRIRKVLTKRRQQAEIERRERPKVRMVDRGDLFEMMGIRGMP